MICQKISRTQRRAMGSQVRVFHQSASTTFATVKGQAFPWRGYCLNGITSGEVNLVTAYERFYKGVGSGDPKRFLPTPDVLTAIPGRLLSEKKREITVAGEGGAPLPCRIVPTFDPDWPYACQFVKNAAGTPSVRHEGTTEGLKQPFTLNRMAITLSTWAAMPDGEHGISASSFDLSAVLGELLQFFPGSREEIKLARNIGRAVAALRNNANSPRPTTISVPGNDYVSMYGFVSISPEAKSAHWFSAPSTQLSVVGHPGNFLTLNLDLLPMGPQGQACDLWIGEKANSLDGLLQAAIPKLLKI